MRVGMFFGSVFMLIATALIILLLLIVVPSTEPTDNDEMETMSFTLGRGSLDFDIRMGDLEGYTQSSVLRFGGAELIGYRYYTPEDHTLIRLVDAIIEKTGHTSGYALAETLLEFVQDNVRYVEDEGVLDHYQFPLETLYYGQGDCEDHACLLATLYGIAGIDSVLINEPGHVTVGVDTTAKGESVTKFGSDTEYYLAEATGFSDIGRGDLGDNFTFPPYTSLFLLGTLLAMLGVFLVSIWMVRQ